MSEEREKERDRNYIVNSDDYPDTEFSGDDNKDPFSQR
jgi:hypothetical protein